MKQEIKYINKWRVRNCIVPNATTDMVITNTHHTGNLSQPDKQQRPVAIYET
jgi:hypothetical protein